MENNKQLTASQSQLYNRTPKTGTTEIAFVNCIPSFTPIKDLVKNNQPIAERLKPIFIRSANALAIANPIAPLSKDEIIEVIKTRFSRLSIEEIEYAFKLDRFGHFGDPTPHYQAFTVDYVAKVLNRFTTWLADTRHENNIALPRRSQEKKEELSEEEKERLVLEGCLRAFEDYKQTARLDPGRSYVYKVLFERGLLPEHTPEFKKGIFERGKRQALERAENAKIEARGDKIKRFNAQQTIDRINAGQIGKTVLREIVLKDFFNKLVIEKKELKDLLCIADSQKTQKPEEKS